MAFVFDMTKTFKRKLYSPENGPGKQLYRCTFYGAFAAGDNYATGGLACDPTASTIWNLSADAVIDGPVNVEPQFGAGAGPTTTYVLKYDRTNKKILMYGAAVGATGVTEAANASASANSMIVAGSCDVMDN